MNHDARPSTSGQRGFTLIELLVALTLLGMVSLMILGGLRFGSRTWERTIESSENLNAVVATQRFLRARLSEASGAVGGAHDRIWFESVWLSSLGAGGVYRFELTLTEEDALLLSWRPADEEEEPREELVGDRELLTGVEAFEVGYFGAPDGEEEAAWSDVWEIEDRPPLLVRIELRLQDARRTWPPLIVALAD
jgi:general secretion pathway protein J